MTYVIFENKEKQYQDWLRSNPDGYVLNTTKNISVEYMPLHCSACLKISKYMINMAKDAFTGQQYIKICSTNPEELFKWIRQKGGKGFTKLCSTCNPLVDKLYQLQIEFEEGVQESISLTSNERKKRLSSATKKPESIIVLTRIFKRNPDVVAEVLHRANGSCEKCGKNAPFNRASNGTPYLEVHHSIRLSDGGDDSVTNAVALCPNCHRKTHYG